MKDLFFSCFFVKELVVNSLGIVPQFEYSTHHECWLVIQPFECFLQLESLVYGYDVIAAQVCI